MSRRFRMTPVLEGMESRLVPSAGLGNLAAAQVHALHSTPKPSVAGVLRGHYITELNHPLIADLPLTFDLNGGGRVGPLGQVQLSGKLYVGGFKPPGSPDTGTLTLTNAKGSITLNVSGTIHTGEEGGVSALKVIVAGGTGAYANTRGLGMGVLRLGPNTIRCITAPCPMGGTFAISLSLNPPRK